MLYGVDVHARYQAGLDIGLLARQGYSFLATKASQGTAVPSVSGFTAAQFKARMLDWIAQTRAAGMVPGLYHWLNAEDGAAQARFFYGLVREAGGPEGMLIQCDNEDDATWQVTQDWAAEWKRLSGGHPWLMYSGRWWWGPRGWPGASLTPYLWDSRYLTADTDTIPDDPAAFASRIPADWWRLPNRWPDPTSFGYGGWSVATILQCSSKLDAGGLANNVDFNATKLTREQLLALTTTTGGAMALTAQDIAAIWAYQVTANTDDKSAGKALWTARSHALAANQRLAGAAPIAALADLPARLDAILAAAQDDGNTTVVLAPEALTELTAIKDALATLPTVTADAVIAEIAS